MGKCRRYDSCIDANVHWRERCRELRRILLEMFRPTNFSLDTPFKIETSIDTE